MEHIRLLLAIVLTIMVFVLWEVFFVPTRAPEPPAEPGRTEKSEQTDTRGPSPQEEGQSGAGTKERVVSAEAGEEAEPVPAKSFKTITVENDLYRAEISEKGAAITRFVLSEYNSEAGPDAAPQELVPAANKTGTALVRPSAPRFADLSNAMYTTDFDRKRLRVRGAPESISFYLQADNGLVIEKQYVFHPDSYRVTLNVSLINQTGASIGSGFLVDMTNPPPDGGRFVFAGPFAYIDQDLEEIDVGDIEDQSVYPGKIRWAGLTDRYFMTALVPADQADTEIRLHENQAENLVRVTYVQPGDSLAPGQRQAHAFELFMGPKRMSELKAFGHDLDEAINFGFFDIIAKPCLWLLL
ncbi:MAG: membrane protein insertase YidC, partial [Desulfobacterales bacterium]|nr:membrane protein insertase YidC [Desulfobacterales bacterium]